MNAGERGRLLTAHVLKALQGARKGTGPAVAEAAMREALRLYPPTQTAQRQGQSCGRADCMCIHSTDPDTGDRCDAGWIEVDSKVSEQVKACRVCFPEKARILSPVETRRSAQAKLREQTKPKKSSGKKS